MRSNDVLKSMNCELLDLIKWDEKLKKFNGNFF